MAQRQLAIEQLRTPRQQLPRVGDLSALSSARHQDQPRARHGFEVAPCTALHQAVALIEPNDPRTQPQVRLVDVEPLRVHARHPHMGLVVPLRVAQGLRVKGRPKRVVIHGCVR